MATTNVTLEDVIIMVPPNHRPVLADLRDKNDQMKAKIFELETDLTFSKQRIAELESQMAAIVSPPIEVSAPAANLSDLIVALRESHVSKIDNVRRKSSDEIRNLEDSGFDAFGQLTTTVSRNMKAMAKNFEFVDLLQLRDQLTSPGVTPISPIQAPLCSDFISQVDSVRQCTKDGRHARIYFDPVKFDILKRMFDACKTVESKLGGTQHLQLPPQSVVFEPSPQAATAEVEGDPTQSRQEESKKHFTVIDSCGQIFDKATEEMAELDELFLVTNTLPHYMPEFEQVLQDMTGLVENLQRNEIILREGGNQQCELISTQRQGLLEVGENIMKEIQQCQKEYEECFTEMEKLLQKVDNIFHREIDFVNRHCGVQKELSLCDRRTSEMRKITAGEISKQSKEIEGAKFTTFLINKSRDLYRRLFSNMEESMRTRRELCDRTRTTSQEQVYAMAENFHSILGKRTQGDATATRTEQQNLETANRGLMGLVQNPAEMEKQMEVIRKHTTVIAQLKQRNTSTGNDLQGLRGLLNKYNTLQFLKRDTNFLSAFDESEKNARLREKIDDYVQRTKFVSEMLVEVSDPDTRQDYVVEQCLEALKRAVGDASELVALRAKIDDLDEPYRLTIAPKLKRHRRLIGHFLEEMQEGAGGLTQQEPTLELHVNTITEATDNIIAALTRNEEPVPTRATFQKQSYGDQPLSASQSVDRRTTSLAPQGTFGGGGQAGSISRSQSMALGQSGGDPQLLGQPNESGIDFNKSTTGSNPNQSFVDPNARAAANFSEIEVERVTETFARVSQRLKVSNESRRLSKPGNSIEMSNTTALGNNGFRHGTGVHSFLVRIGPSCTRLLVGLADWNIPLDGYCNSLRYGSCYYLHLGNGTLWAPGLGIERKQFTFEAIGGTVDSLLKVIVDTDHRTISYVWGDMNLGVAFRNVDFSRSLYPAFEVFSNGTVVEFVNVDPMADQSPK